MKIAPTIGAVIMASGDSARFGGGNKLLAAFEGKPLIQHTLDALPQKLFNRIVVVTRDTEVATIAASSGYNSILHELPYVSDTIHFGLERMIDMDRCMFLVADQPYLKDESIAAIAEASAQNSEGIYRAAFGAQVGNPVVFPKTLYPELLTLKTNQQGGTVIKRHPALVTLVNVFDPRELLDIDTVDDLIRLAQA